MSRTPAAKPAARWGMSAAVTAARSRRSRLSAVHWAIIILSAVGLGLRLFQLSRPGFLFGVIEYDDGTDFGSAIRLVTGSLPYRDFIMVQPPGITLLMTPAALLSKSVGTSGAIAVGRILTVLAGTGCVFLAGWLVRHRGLLAVAISCGIVAILPDSVEAAKSVLLEPWLVLFCLAGAVAVFDSDRITGSTRRLAGAGLLLGFAGAIKVWAILPVVVIAVLAARWPKRAGLFITGVAVGFLVPVVPFAALAPRAFYDSVVVAQLIRTDLVRVPTGQRLANMVGLSRDANLPPGLTIIIVSVLFVLLIVGSCVLASRLTRRGPAPLEWFALGSLALVVIAFLWPADFYYHYAAFSAPFLGLATALPVARLADALRQRGGQREPARQDAGRSWSGWLPAGAVWVAGLVLAVFTVAEGVGVSEMVAAVPPSEIAHAKRIIPPGACVLADQQSYSIAANRFVSTVPGCSVMVDGVGTDYALAQGRNGLTGAGESPVVRAIWMSAFRHAQYVWLTGVSNRRIPWTPGLRAYFAQHFVPLVEGPNWLYGRTNGTPR